MLRYYKDEMHSIKTSYQSMIVDESGVLLIKEGVKENTIDIPASTFYWVEHNHGELMIEANIPKGDYIEVDKSEFDQYWKDFVEKNKHNFGEKE